MNINGAPPERGMQLVGSENSSTASGALGHRVFSEAKEIQALQPKQPKKSFLIRAASHFFGSVKERYFQKSERDLLKKENDKIIKILSHSLYEHFEPICIDENIVCLNNESRYHRNAEVEFCKNLKQAVKDEEALNNILKVSGKKQILAIKGHTLKIKIQVSKDAAGKPKKGCYNLLIQAKKEPTSKDIESVDKYYQKSYNSISLSDLQKCLLEKFLCKQEIDKGGVSLFQELLLAPLPSDEDQVLASPPSDEAQALASPPSYEDQALVPPPSYDAVVLPPSYEEANYHLPSYDELFSDSFYQQQMESPVTMGSDENSSISGDGDSGYSGSLDSDSDSDSDSGELGSYQDTRM